MLLLTKISGNSRIMPCGILFIRHYWVTLLPSYRLTASGGNGEVILFVHTFLEGWVIFWHAIIYFENLHICACICENIFRVNPCVSKKFHSLPLSTAISLVNIRLVKIHQFEDCPTWETGKKTPNQWGWDVVLVDEADRCTALRFDDTTVNHPTNYRLCANRGRKMS